METSLKHLLLLSGVAMLAACSKSPAPDDDCLDPSYRVELMVDVDVDNSLSHYAEVDSVRYVDPSIVGRQTKAGARAEDWAVRYYVAAYRRNDTEPFEMASSLQNPVKLSLPPNRYTIVGWADHVPEDNGKSHHFYTSDFSDILLRNKYEYKANDLTKMGYRGVSEARVGYTTTHAPLHLKSAMARYRLLATDTADYQVGKVMVYYKDVPASIHAVTGEINHGWNDVQYESMPQDGQLAFDHVLAHDTREVVTNICVEIFDERGNLRNRVRNIGIPLKNGGITTVKGNFYSVLDLDDDETAGGITIDTEFDATIEIEI